MVVQKPGKTTLGISLLLLLTSVAHAAPPAQLYGKSVKLSWTESRMERKMGESDFHGKSIGQYVNIYISSTGKIFNRYGAFAGRKSGKQKDEISGQAGSNRGVTLRGNTLEFFQAFGGGARHIVATFDSTFSSCTATAAYASAAGGGPQFLGHTAISGERLEVKSMSGGGASCSIQEGNVFAQ
jgi:hypothetical protein